VRFVKPNSGIGEKRADVKNREARPFPALAPLPAMPAELLPPILDTRGLRLSPTDISQFIRLEQCERYLRLRLHSRAEA
jgi:hypothetical protein